MTRGTRRRSWTTKKFYKLKEELIMDYLFMGYSAIWALVAGYVVVLGRRQKQLEKEIQQLEEWNTTE
jgi:CcmD family protein